MVQPRILGRCESPHNKGTVHGLQWFEYLLQVLWGEGGFVPLRGIWIGDEHFSSGPNVWSDHRWALTASRALVTAYGCLKTINHKNVYMSVSGLKIMRITGFPIGLHRQILLGIWEVRILPPSPFLPCLPLQWLWSILHSDLSHGTIHKLGDSWLEQLGRILSLPSNRAPGESGRCGRIHVP